MQTPAEAVQRYKVALALPGVTFHFGVFHAALAACMSQEHEVGAMHGNDQFENLNSCWAEALNLFEAGQITHFAMIHSDIWPKVDFAKRDWLSVLIGEMDQFGASLVSAAVPIKDRRGLFSCGIGDPNNRYSPLRRLTSREFMKLPPTIGAKDMGYPDGMLLHNNGLWVADLRYEEFRAVDENGDLRCTFDYPKKIRRYPKNGALKILGESEDWYFSRQIHELGLRNTYVTRKVGLTHPGWIHYPNDDSWGPDGWGVYQNGDEDTANKWRKGDTHESQSPSQPGPGVEVRNGRAVEMA